MPLSILLAAPLALGAISASLHPATHAMVTQTAHDAVFDEDIEDGVVVKTRASSAVDFTAVEIVGAVEGPTMRRTVARKRRHFRNMIELRTNFRPELQRTSQQLAPSP